MTVGADFGRLQNTFWRAGEMLLMHHTNPWELDAALVSWGYGIGPCEAQDLLGLEPALSRDPLGRLPILPRMVAEGRMGKIGGVGYYRYPGGGGAVIDPLIEDLIREEAWFAKVTRVECEDADLVDVMNAALVTGAREIVKGGLANEAVAEKLAQAVHFPKSRLKDLACRTLWDR